MSWQRRDMPALLVAEMIRANAAEVEAEDEGVTMTSVLVVVSIKISCMG